MEDRDCVHAGHRKRMADKVLFNADGLAEHELLEVLLYKSIPRKDTNEIAHKLLRMFGSLEKVFSAEPSQLCAIDGIGRSTAADIIVTGKIFKQLSTKETKLKSNKAWSSFDNIKSEIVEYFSQIKEEKFIVVLLNGKYEKLNFMEYKTQEKDKVSVDVAEILRAFALHKPKGVVIAHNHPSGNVAPSEADDNTTKKMNILCSLHGVSLVDHVIVSKENCYSYFQDGRMNFIRELADLDKMIAKHKEE